MADEQKPNLSEPTKNEIWHEVERRFEHPPASLVERIEKEVEKRVAARESHYRQMLVVVGSLFGLVVLVAGYVSYSAIQKDVEEKITTNEVAQVIQNMRNDLASANSQSEDISNLTVFVHARADEVAHLRQDIQSMSEGLNHMRSAASKDSDAIRYDSLLVANLATAAKENGQTITNLVVQLNKNEADKKIRLINETFTRIEDTGVEVSNRSARIVDHYNEIGRQKVEIDSILATLNHMRSSSARDSDAIRGELGQIRSDSILISNLVLSAKENEQAITNHLAQLNQQDNVVLVDELPQMFVYERIKNISGNTVTLDYEPIEHTVKLFLGGNLTSTGWPFDFKVEGRTVTFNRTSGETIAGWTNSESNANIQYVRKFITKP
jgi:enamine deaminase RidA (YjgF/YER057c/UK114 family)